MSAERPELDLDALTRERPLAPPRRRWGFLLPLAILAVFLAILGWSARDLFGQRVPVTIVRARAGAAAISTSGVLLQAAGWVEPDPFALEVRALLAGSVVEMLVQESDRVEAGAVVARLVDTDERLALSAAQALLEEARARVTAAQAEEALRGAAVRKSGATIRVLEEELRLQEHLVAQDASGPRQVELARARLEEAEADLDIVRAEAARATGESAASRAREAGAAVEIARAELALARTAVVSPWGGIVLTCLAQPGSWLGHGMDGSVCTLYDPQKLRVRVDVPQEEIGRLEKGQRARIQSEARRDQPYTGEIVRILHRADIQKVTMQVHVRILDPDELLRPEMLCQVGFLAPEQVSATPAAGQSTVWVPSRLVADGKVWVLDATGERASARPIEIGASDAEWTEVRAGIDLSDELIDAGRESVHEGSLVRVRSEP